MEIKQEVVYDNGTSDFCFSLKKQQYIKTDGERTYIGQIGRLPVSPGEFEKVEAFAPELLPIMRGFWTPEVITEYAEKIKNLLLPFGANVNNAREAESAESDTE